MTYELTIGDRTFSSWSLRGWLMFRNFGLPVKVRMADLYGPHFREDMAKLAPAHLVPVMRTPEGILLGETIAMAETLAERHPDAGLWPADPAARAAARWLVAEMHAGFTALRDACSMQLQWQYEGFKPSEAVQADLDRLAELFAYARQHATSGPWLLGQYSLADVFYAPVAARIAGYGLDVAPEVAAFTALTLSDPAFLEWREAALDERHDPFPYPQALPHHAWPTLETRKPALT